ncbi:MAG: hypothetical protein IJZ87_05950, partial [Bacteroidales bacterium]|nr:hypothetical protein [Bacteroidales bacterium]
MNFNVLNAQEVEIGEDQNTSTVATSLPYHNTTAQSVTQQIYLESDFDGYTGAINSEIPKTRNIVFTLKDGHGDGWNGGYLIVAADDGTNQMLDLEDGETATYTLEIAQGATVTVTYTAGYWSEENSYCIAYEGEDDFVCSESQGTINSSNIYTFTVEVPVPTIEVSTEPIAFGDVRMGDYWSEKDPKLVQLDVVVKHTTITDVACNNTLFVAEYNSNESVINVSCNKNANVTGEQSGTITITSADCDPVTVAVTATAYTAVEPDAIEAYITVDFEEDNSFTNTPIFTNLHDDYKLPNEATDGNAPDAVYKFTLENTGLVTVNVEGTNGMAAIYKEFGEDEGPSSDNNYEGYVPEVVAKSRNATPQIDAVQYERGTYYLVAAAESEFTMTLSLSELVAPEAVIYTAPEDNAMNMDDPKLTWTFGKYTEEYQVLFGTDPENLTVVVDWTSQLATEYQTSDLEIATKYYWQVNAKNEVGTTYGAVRSFVSALPAPTNLTTEYEDYIFVEGESNIVLTWDAIEGVTYNVYKRGAYNNQTGYEYELLGTTENNSYEITSEHDIEGSYYAVSAVYEEVYESDKTLTDYRIYVTGYSSIKGVITNGTNPIAGLTFEIVGESVLGEDIIIIETDENGAFNVLVLEGTYTITISHYDYEEYVKTDVICVYDNVNDRGEIALTAKPAAEDVEVTAAIVSGNANIIWTGDYTKYNVYRRNVDEPQELTIIAEGLTEKECQDTDWTTLEVGSYQYGVEALVEQQSSELVEIINEGFEDNKIPDTWHRYREEMTANPDAEWNVGPTLPNSISVNDDCGTYFAYSAGKARDGNKYHLVTPEINASDCVLSFYYAAPAWVDDKSTLEVLYSSNQEGPWISLEWSVEDVPSWNHAEIDLSSIEGSFYISFCVTDRWGYGVALDNVFLKGKTLVVEETQPVWSNVLEKKADFVFNNAAGDNDWHNEANWAVGELPGSGDNVVLNAKAVITTDVEVNNLSTGTNQLVVNSGTLTVNGQLNVNQNDQYDGYYLVINDGAQLLQNNDGVPATFKMNITKPETWNEGSDGWQFISTPFTDANVNMFASTQYYNEEIGNYEETDYALFKYDGEAEKEWDNIKENPNSFEIQFVLGRAYLASQEHKDVVTLEGTLNSAKTHEWTVSHNGEKELANYHLLGNPFSFNMDWSNITVEGVYNGFATVNSADGSYDYSTTGTVNVGDGFFVRATAENPTISYGASKGQRDKGEKVESINLIATGANGDDNAIINFADADEEGFLKLDNFNSAIAEIYVANNGRRYAISNFDRETTEIAVSFDAKQMGNYTIAAQPQGKFQSVILVDRFTGVETDLLTDSYTFTATGSENHDRFIVKLANSQEPTANSNFAY